MRRRRRPSPSWWVAGLGAVIVLTVGATAYAVVRARRRKVSVWWDVIGPATIRHLDRHIANLKALGVSSVTIMLTEPDGGSNFTVQELATFTTALRASGIAFGLDLWSHPTQRFVASLPGLSRLAAALGARFIEFDTESNWSSASVRGYGSLSEASRAVAQVMSVSPVPWGITTVPGRPASVTLGQYGSFVVPQAYSVDREGVVEPRDELPGSYQAKAYRLTRKQYGSMRMVMGLPAWDQEFSGMDPAEAMIVAAREAFDLGVNEVCFWSWKYIGGSDGTPRLRYAFNALAQLSQAVG